ncbi:serine/threonine protein kinase [Actinokineospora sp. G85]|uniref:serine/threonine protein kinase n=1 Tax=Actinokineospora sp. G85 TaxID=3406626 RepID=UPI003C7388E0
MATFGTRALTRIGDGPSATVYAARRGDARVALKAYPKRFDKRTMSAFTKEQAKLATVSRIPSILAVEGVDELESGEPALRMRLCAESLAALVERRGPLPPSDVVALGRAMAVALAAAHEAGVVHGGVSPSNVLFLPTGQPALADFGVTLRQAFARDPLHAIEYLPPETLRTGVLDESTDLYGLGAVLHYALSARCPHPGRLGEQPGERVLRILGEPVPAINAPDTPVALTTLIARLLAATPAHRPTSAAQVAEQLTALLPTPAQDPPFDDFASHPAPFTPTPQTPDDFDDFAHPPARPASPPGVPAFPAPPPGSFPATPGFPVPPPRPSAHTPLPASTSSAPAFPPPAPASPPGSFPPAQNPLPAPTSGAQAYPPPSPPSPFPASSSPVPQPRSTAQTPFPPTTLATPTATPPAPVPHPQASSPAQPQPAAVAPAPLPTTSPRARRPAPPQQAHPLASPAGGGPSAQASDGSGLLPAAPPTASTPVIPPPVTPSPAWETPQDETTTSPGAADPPPIPDHSSPWAAPAHAPEPAWEAGGFDPPSWDPTPPPADPPRSSLRTPLLVGGPLAAILLVVLLVVLLSSEPDELPVTDRPAPPPEAVVVELAEPVDLVDKVQLTWHSSRAMDYAVVIAAEGAPKPDVRLAERRNSMTVAVEPGRRYCFLIQATDGTSERVHESKPRSLRGATCRNP